MVRAWVRRGLLDQGDADEMGGWHHGGGFSLDASVRIAGADRAGRERLLRYCARPPFALEHLQEHDAGHLLYPCPKPGPDGPSALVLTPLEPIDRIAALVPPPRTHRHRYYGVLAPQRALARGGHRAGSGAGSATATATGGPCRGAGGVAAPRCARYLWTMLLAHIYAAFPLTCPFCHTPMRIIAFINEARTV